MPFDLSKHEDRRKIIQMVKSNEEKYRKEESLRQTEVFNDRILQYVEQLLHKKYSPSTVKMMPKIASINLCRRVIKSEASLYKDEPDREFSELSDDATEAVAAIYKDGNVDAKLNQSNQSFKLQNQNHVIIFPKDGKLVWRVLRNHHVTVIPDDDDPETAYGYILSGFDKNEFLQDVNSNTNTALTNTDGVNAKFADTEDYKSASERHVVWTKEQHCKMDGKGNVLGKAAETGNFDNEIKIIPIFEVSIEKDFEYWVRQGATLVDFTIDYNVAWSSQQQINEMQGFAQAVLIGEADTENFTVGPNHILNLKPGTDESGNQVIPDFKFVNPNPDLNGSFQHIQGLLANFLSSRGLNPKLVSGSGDSESFTSGLDRLLSMIDRFEASKEDINAYKSAEVQQYEIIKAWVNALSDTEELDSKYKANIPEDSQVSVMHKRPEMIETEDQRLQNSTTRREENLASIVDNIMETYGFKDRQQAWDKAKQIIKDEKEYREMQLADSGIED